MDIASPEQVANLRGHWGLVPGLFANHIGKKLDCQIGEKISLNPLASQHWETP